MKRIIMGKIVGKMIPWLSVLLLLAGAVLAQETSPEASSETSLPDPGTTPDSFFYFMDTLAENMALAATFDADAKIEKRLEIAQEKLAEARAMALEKKMAAMEKANEKHGQMLAKLKTDLKEIENGDAEAELRKELEIERKMRKHSRNIDEVKDELRVKIEFSGELTPEQQELISSILASLKGQSGEVEIEIDNEKGKTKIKIEQELGQDGEDFESRLKQEMGITEEEKKHALRQIDKVRTNLESFFTEAGVTASEEEMQQLQQLMDQAREAFAAGNFEEAEELGDAIKELMDDQVEDLIKSRMEIGATVRETATLGTGYRYEPQEWAGYWDDFQRYKQDLKKEQLEEMQEEMERYRQQWQNARISPPGQPAFGDSSGPGPGWRPGEREAEQERPEDFEGNFEDLSEEEIREQYRRWQERQPDEQETEPEAPDAEDLSAGERARMEEQYQNSQGGDSGSSPDTGTGESNGGTDGSTSSGPSGDSDQSGSSGEGSSAGSGSADEGFSISGNGE